MADITWRVYLACGHRKAMKLDMGEDPPERGDRTLCLVCTQGYGSPTLAAIVFLELVGMVDPQTPVRGLHGRPARP